MRERENGKRGRWGERDEGREAEEGHKKRKERGRIWKGKESEVERNREKKKQ